jgi:hypothetical protein
MSPVPPRWTSGPSTLHRCAPKWSTQYLGGTLKGTAMTLLVLIIVWLTLSPVLALACAAFIRAGEGPRQKAPLPLAPEPQDTTSADPRPRAD